MSPPDHPSGLSLTLRVWRQPSASAPGRLVDYKQMIHEAWDGNQVSRHTVRVTIGEIKHLLGEYGHWINCQPKFGYRLEIRNRTASSVEAGTIGTNTPSAAMIMRCAAFKRPPGKIAPISAHGKASPAAISCSRAL